MHSLNVVDIGFCCRILMFLVWKDFQDYSRVVSIVSVESRYTCGGILGVVIYESGQWKQLAPIVLVIVIINLQVLFHRLVLS